MDAKSRLGYVRALLVEFISRVQRKTDAYEESLLQRKAVLRSLEVIRSRFRYRGATRKGTPDEVRATSRGFEPDRELLSDMAEQAIQQLLITGSAFESRMARSKIPGVARLFAAPCERPNRASIFISTPCGRSRRRMDASLESTDLPLFWLAIEQKATRCSLSPFVYKSPRPSVDASCGPFSSSPTQLDAEGSRVCGRPIARPMRLSPQAAMKVVERRTRKDDSTHMCNRGTGIVIAVPV
jgi:hypothetical protein